MVLSVDENISVTQIRLQLLIPQYYYQQPVISQLISDRSLVVNITAAMLGENTEKQGCFDLELKGTIPQICSGLTYLQSLNIKIVGKGNAFGDGWHC